MDCQQRVLDLGDLRGNHQQRKLQFELMVFYVYHLFLATDKKLAEIAWKCSICHQCIDVCPQDIKPGEIYTSIKEWSFHNHTAPDDIYKLMKTLINDGIIFSQSKMTQRKREQLDLPPMKEQPVDELMIIAQNIYGSTAFY